MSIKYKNLHASFHCDILNSFFLFLKKKFNCFWSRNTHIKNLYRQKYNHFQVFSFIIQKKKQKLFSVILLFIYKLDYDIHFLLRKGLQDTLQSRCCFYFYCGHHILTVACCYFHCCYRFDSKP